MVLRIKRNEDAVSTMTWLLIGYMWLFVHRPFEIWPWLGELRVERLFMLMLLIYWAIFVKKKWIKNRINLGVGLMATAIIFATAFSSCATFNSLVVEKWFKILIFYFLIMTSVQKISEFKIIILAFVIIMGIYEIHSLREYLCGRGEYRMGIWRMVGVGESLNDPNSFAASVNYGIPMFLPLFVLSKKKWHYLALVVLLSLSILCILLTGSRTGFAALGLLIIGTCIVSKHRKRLIPIAALFIALVWFNMSGDLQNRYLTLIDPSRGPANAQGSAQSRKEFFYMAVEIFKKSPLFGIGPGCFGSVSRTEMQVHTIYGQILSDLGAVGIFAFLILVTGYFQNYLEGQRLWRSSLDTEDLRFCYRVLMAVAIVILQLLFMGLGGHNLYRYNWLWFGAISALSLKFLYVASYGTKRAIEEK